MSAKTLTRLQGVRTCSRCKRYARKLHKRGGFLHCEMCIRELQGFPKILGTLPDWSNPSISFWQKLIKWIKELFKR